MSAFDRFTDGARATMSRAREESASQGALYLGTDHLLIGLLRVEGRASDALAGAGVELDAARAAIAEFVDVEPAPILPELDAPRHLPFTPRLKRVLELAVEEAASLGHGYLGAEHLLAGLLRNDEGVGFQALVHLGKAPETIRHQLLLSLAEGVVSDVVYETRRSPVDAVRAYLDAFFAGRPDLERVRRLLHDDFTFVGPLMTADSADGFIAKVRGMMAEGGGGEMRHELRRLIADGENVAALYDFLGPGPDGRIAFAEWFRVVDGRIASIELHYDPRPLLP